MDVIDVDNVVPATLNPELLNELSDEPPGVFRYIRHGVLVCRTSAVNHGGPGASDKRLGAGPAVASTTLVPCYQPPEMDNRQDQAEETAEITRVVDVGLS